MARKAKVKKQQKGNFKKLGAIAVLLFVVSAVVYGAVQVSSQEDQLGN